MIKISMSIQKLFFLAICGVFFTSAAFSQSEFSRRLGIAGYESPMSLQLANGDFIAIADTLVNGSLEMVAMRLDTAGQTRASWSLAFQPVFPGTFPFSLARLKDGRIAVVGLGFVGFQRGLICLLDSTGQGIVGDMTTHTPSGMRWWDVAATADSGLVVAGSGHGSSRGLVACYDKHLGLRWAKVLTNLAQQSDLLSVTELAGGGFMVAGFYYPPPHYQQAFLLRLDDQGDFVWMKSYSMGDPLRSRWFDMHYDGNDRLYLVGDTTRNWEPQQMALLAIDTAGTFLWGKLLDNPNGPGDVVKDIITLPSGDLLMYGTRTVTGARDEGVCAAFSSAGNLLWDRRFQSPSSNLSIDHVIPLHDGGLMWMLLEDYSHKRLVKTDGQGMMSLPCGPSPINYTVTPMMNFSATPVTGFSTVNGITNTPLVVSNTNRTLNNQLECGAVGLAQARPALAAQVLPQPMYTRARILFSEDIADDAQLHITDLSGRSLSLPVTRLADGWEIQRGGLPAGIYAYQVLQDGQRIASGKLWVAD
jgi:hypothetical protein